MSNYKSYFYKSLGLREDQLPGGKGDETSPNEVDQEQLQMGIKVEMEHTHDQDLAKEIAMDHLTEDPQYYSNLKNAGMADELPNGQQPPNQPPMQMQKLMPSAKPMGVSPTAIMPTPVIAVGVRGSNTGGFPGGGEINTSEKSRLGGLEPIKVLSKGGAIGDKEKARLGGLELVKNPKANSQGAFANTPSSDALKADGGHYTPDNKDISKGQGPETSKKGDDYEHPMQFQKMGNPPPKDDGTGRNGEGLKPVTPKETEKHPMSGPIAGPEGGDNEEKDLSKAGIDDEPAKDEGEPKKGPWGIELDDKEEDEEEGEDVEIDVKEKKLQECNDESMKNRFQQLANIPAKRKQLEELVGRLNAKGKVTPLLQKAQAYLVKSK